jgi:hypothetical protein
MLVNMFHVLVGVQSAGGVFDFQETIRLINEAFIHFYFFYRLCCVSTQMTNEVIKEGSQFTPDSS